MRSKNIVFVHGMFGWGPSEMGGLPYWGEALSLNTHGFKVHEASCGPASSFHDRACEVAAQIKGAIVDYGEDHSQSAGHEQFSDDFTGKGFISDWSENNPVILVGHSAGAQTCMLLQQLLADDYWQWGSNANWVEVIMPISGVINGSLLPYKLGCDKKTGLLTGSTGEFIGSLIQVLGLVTGNSNKYDFDLDQWIGSGYGNDFGEMINVLDASKFAEGEDNLAFDLTLQGCFKANEKFKTNPDTYYLSIVTEQTRNGFPQGLLNPILLPSAIAQGLVNFRDKPIPNWGAGDLNIRAWKENDGAVSSISQRYPFTAGNHSVGGEGIFNGERLSKGSWYFENADKITGKRFDHLDIGFGYKSDPTLKNAHIELYNKIYKLLSEL